MEHFLYCEETIDQRKNCEETPGTHLQETQDPFSHLGGGLGLEGGVSKGATLLVYE